ncbi:hypothetical protein QB910_000086 [Dabrowskivirus KKP3916]|uniref:Dephospho-CoA kinase n=1 Tax=Alicyclobacillus phage KKP_3916 TaxID=3040651 RepID=A0AAT9V7R4_9CAUD|nr:hypothetical protein QB910_000086 [Alicyclobacillus phage KKP 3916]
MCVAIHGRAYAGKDTVASMFIDEGYVRIAFADPVYTIAKRFFFMRKKNRRILQLIGQGARYLINRDIWVRIAMRKINATISEGKPVVVTDLRQENEFLALYRAGFTIIHVDASLEVRQERCRLRDGIEPQPELWEAKSETGADQFIDLMYSIDNSGTLEQLREQVDKILKG